MGRPSASTTRPIIAGPTGTSSTRLGATHLVAFLELQVVAEHDGADVVLFEVEREAGDRLCRSRTAVNSSISPAIAFAEAVDAGNAVLHLEDRTDFLDVEISEVSRFDLAEKDVLNFAGAEGGLRGHETRAMNAEETSQKQRHAPFRL
jgi:hypothetical protein